MDTTRGNFTAVCVTFCRLWCLLDPTVSQIDSSVQQTRLNGWFSAKLVHWISSAGSDKPQGWMVGEMLWVRKESRRGELGRGSKKSSFWQIDSALWYNLTSNMWFHAVPNAVSYRQSPSHTLRYGFLSQKKMPDLHSCVTACGSHQLPAHPGTIQACNQLMSSARSWCELREQQCVAEEEGRSPL